VGQETLARRNDPSRNANVAVDTAEVVGLPSKARWTQMFRNPFLSASSALNGRGTSAVQIRANARFRPGVDGRIVGYDLCIMTEGDERCCPLTSLAQSRARSRSRLIAD
jgi:hypothetical protein